MLPRHSEPHGIPRPESRCHPLDHPSSARDR
jgi:hypothetical protein